MPMLVDKVVITIHAGKGGDGAVSFRTREGNPRGGPDGGNGGKGGDVFLKGVNDLTALAVFQYKKIWKAEDGVSGKKNNLFGRNAPNLTIDLPFGTIVRNINNNESFEIIDTSTRLVAKGGIGGRGNNEFKSATNQTPRFAEKGKPGEEVVLDLELKLIAQIGLIGLPNVGKSTLLSLLTNARPKIGNYHFTTIEPNVGMLEEVMIADIPGLIEGASKGRGLGIAFLKHIEKTEFLVHCVDASSPDPLGGYEIVRRELGDYNQHLLSKKELILLTKIDLVKEDELRDILGKFANKAANIFSISVYDKKKVLELKQLLLKTYQSSQH